MPNNEPPPDSSIGIPWQEESSKIKTKGKNVNNNKHSNVAKVRGDTKAGPSTAMKRRAQDSESESQSESSDSDSDFDQAHVNPQPPQAKKVEKKRVKKLRKVRGDPKELFVSLRYQHHFNFLFNANSNFINKHDKNMEVLSIRNNMKF